MYDYFLFSVSSALHCGALRYQIWLCLQETNTDKYGSQPYYSFQLFEGLQFSTPNLGTGAPETLCHLDLLAFLAATVFCYKTSEKQGNILYFVLLCKMKYSEV